MILNFGFSKKMSVLIHLLAFLVLTSYATHHILNEMIIIGTLLFISAAFLAYSLVLALKGHNSPQALRRFCLVMTLSIIVTCYYLGIRGIIFVFPLITSYFYCFSYQKAIIWSCLSIISTLLALLNMVEPIIVGRLFLALIINLSINISIASLVYRQKQTLTKEAREDQLTGFPNRRHFNELLTKALGAAKTTNNSVALLFIDLDNFKQVNDVYGHTIGDYVLKEASVRLQSSLRENDTIYRVGENEHIARLGGDEFAAIIKGVSAVDEVINVVERILQKISQPYKTEGFTLNCHASIGVALNDDNTDSAKTLIKKADSAMYQAKKNGKKRYQLFDQKIFKMMAEEQNMQRCLQNALVNKLFYLNFMPIFNAKTMRIDAVEVLLRVSCQQLSYYGPERFIPVAEQYDLIYEIDLWVVENAFIQIKEYCRNYKNTPLIFCINLSSKELENKSIEKEIAELMTKYEISPELVEFEITESSLVECGEKSINILTSLKDLGVSLSLDDFGTGYTSFNQLRQYPIDTLKIDRSFIAEIQNNSPIKNCMAKVITSMAEIYELKVVAEGVENEKQLIYLKGINCNLLQGFYLGKPQSWLDIERNYLYDLQKFKIIKVSND